MSFLVWHQGTIEPNFSANNPEDFLLNNQHIVQWCIWIDQATHFLDILALLYSHLNIGIGKVVCLVQRWKVPNIFTNHSQYLYFFKLLKQLVKNAKKAPCRNNGDRQKLVLILLFPLQSHFQDSTPRPEFPLFRGWAAISIENWPAPLFFYGSTGPSLHKIFSC